MNVPFRHPSYEVLGELGRGGVGRVLHARHRELGTEVAVKLLLASDPGWESLERFRREARLLAALKHPHILPVHDLGVHGEVAFLVLDLVAGRDLDARVRGGELRDPRAVARVMAPIADAVSYCHDRGVLHRDLKPSNVLIEDGTGRPVLIDFGLGRRPDAETISDQLTQAGQALGTPAYMAPEQADDEAGFGVPGPPTDVWGLGATLFFCLSRRAPIEGASIINLLNSLLTEARPRVRDVAPDAPSALADLTDRCLVRDGARRPSAAEVAEELARIAAGDDASVVAGRPRVPVVAVGVALGLLIGAVGMAAVAVALRSGASGGFVDAVADGSAGVRPTPTPTPTPTEPPDRPLARWDLASLLDELHDLDGLTRQPPAGWTLEHHDAIDRSPDARRYLLDPRHLERIDIDGEDEHVIARVEGPGCLVALRGQRDPARRVRIYLDSATAPFLEIPLAAPWTAHRALAPFRPERVDAYDDLHALLLPIPFARSCLVTADRPAGRVQVTFRRPDPDAPGLEVVTARRADLAEPAVRRRIEEAARRLVAPAPPAPDRSEPRRFAGTLPAGGELVVHEASLAPDTGEEIVELRFHLASPGGEGGGVVDADRLRHVLLVAEFDDDERCIEAPLADLTGLAAAPSSARSFPASFEDGTLVLRWPMPYARRARVALRSHADEPVEVTASVRTRPRRWDLTSLHLHARWAVATVEGGDASPVPAIELVALRGAGVLVGAAVTRVHRPFDWTEVVAVGLEADGRPVEPAAPLPDALAAGHGWLGRSQSLVGSTGPQLPPGGRRSFYRWRLLDRLPFEEEVRVLLAGSFGWTGRRASVAALVLAYVAPGAPPPAPIDAASLAFPQLPGSILTRGPRGEWVLEPLTLRVLEVSDGFVEHQDMKRFTRIGESWSLDDQLFWARHDETAPGGRLVLGLPIPERGRWTIGVVCTTARDYAKFQFSLAGGSRVEYDLSVSEGTKIGKTAFAFVPCELPAGLTRLTIVRQAVGRGGGRRFGIDRITLERAD